MEKNFEYYMQEAIGGDAVSQLASKFKPSKRDHGYYIKQAISDLKFAKQEIPVKFSLHGEQREKEINNILEILNEWVKE